MRSRNMINPNDMPEAFLAEGIDDSDWKSVCYSRSNQDFIVVVPGVRTVGAIKEKDMIVKGPAVKNFHVITLTVADIGQINLEFETHRQAIRFRNRLLAKIESYWMKSMC